MFLEQLLGEMPLAKFGKDYYLKLLCARSSG
jgi:hypothetical protein